MEITFDIFNGFGLSIEYVRKDPEEDIDESVFHSADRLIRSRLMPASEEVAKHSSYYPQHVRLSFPPNFEFAAVN